VEALIGPRSAILVVITKPNICLPWCSKGGAPLDVAWRGGHHAHCALHGTLRHAPAKETPAPPDYRRREIATDSTHFLPTALATAAPQVETSASESFATA